MPSVQSTKNSITHLPLAPSSSPGATVNVPGVAGNSGTRTLAALTAGPRPLILSGITVLIDLTQLTAMNIVDLINGKNIPGVTASLDRYGQLNVNGVSAVGGDQLLLQHLGFN